MKPFDTIPKLDKALIDNLAKLGFTAMRPIQEQSIPHLLDGKDIIAQAKTGSGKTLAFGIPTIARIDISRLEPQAIILAPVRELADQIALELRKAAAYRPNLKIITLCGGASLTKQAASLEKGAHIIVGTPGRIEDHLYRETLTLDKIRMLVLDEADRMLDMGFYDAITKIAGQITGERQSMLFSATFPPKIEKIAAELLNDPLRITVDSEHGEETFSEYGYECGSGERDEALIALLQGYRPRSAAIFCNTKEQVANVTVYLLDHDFDAIDLQGDLDQRERTETLIQFANGSIPILVATDVASRGLDIKDIELIVNYDLPFSAETYTHRKGRSGRSGAQGTILSLYEGGQKGKLKEFGNIELRSLDTLECDSSFRAQSTLRTVTINGGKKNKLRAGDILGCLGKDIGIEGKQIGKIDITDQRSYVALDKKVLSKALKGLAKVKIKGKMYKGWEL